MKTGRKIREEVTETAQVFHPNDLGGVSGAWEEFLVIHGHNGDKKKAKGWHVRLRGAGNVSFQQHKESSRDNLLLPWSSSEL